MREERASLPLMLMILALAIGVGVEIGAGLAGDDRLFNAVALVVTAWLFVTFALLNREKRRRRACLTPGANYRCRIEGDRVDVYVDLPRSVVTPRDAERLEGAIHDGLERALAPLWETRS